MKLKLTHLALTAVALGLQAAPAAAHIFYKGNIPLKGSGGKQGNMDIFANGGGHGDWTVAAGPGMPAMSGGPIAGGDLPTMIRFHLDQDSLVNLSVTSVAVPGASTTPKDRNTWSGGANLDPAVSLYQGLLPAEAMDELVSSGVGDDAITNGETTLYANSLYWGSYTTTKVHSLDSNPWDPAIPHVIAQIDPATGSQLHDDNGMVLMQVNPDWDDPARSLAVLALDPTYLKYNTNFNLIELAFYKGEGDLTPRQWYEKHYTPHNGYRDTLNYTAVGGSVVPGDPRLAMTGLYNVGGLPNCNGTMWVCWSWNGEIDALGDFSMSNHAAILHPDSAATESYYPNIALNPAGVDWAKIYYVGHANAHDGESHPGSDGSTPAAYPNLSPERLHNQILAKGDYTIYAAGGCSGCIDESGYPTNPLLKNSSSSSFHYSLQTWPVQDCSLSTPAKAKPEIAPISGPWDVEAGQTLNMPLGAHYCSSNPPTFSATGLSDATVATTSAVNARTGYINVDGGVDEYGNPISIPNRLGWQSQLSWTADNVTEVTTRKVSISVADGSKLSKPQKTSVRIWPVGINPGNSFDFQAPVIKWDANNANLSLTAKVTLKNAKVLLPEEKASIYGRPLYLLGNESGSMSMDLPDGFLGYNRTNGFAPFANNKGQIKYSTKLDATTVPCKVQWVFGHFTGLATVANAPGNCVQ